MFEKLRYIAPEVEKAISEDNFAGVNISVIYKGEEVYSESFGMADKEKNIPMTKDKLFRLFSLTKPVTAAAAMTLLERGRIEMRYPVKWFLPTFENPIILDSGGKRPASRDITLGDLMSMTSGIPYPDGCSPAGMAMGELWGLQDYNYRHGKKLMTTREFALEMGKKPLAFDPGEKWQYGASADIMGAVIEAVTGMTLGQYFRQEIFEPLGMTDTGFYVPKDKLDRLAQVYDRTENGNMPYTDYNLCIFDCKEPPAFESGGAGLVSTIGDYSKFVKTLMSGGGNILGRKTVRYMRTNCLTREQMRSLDWDSMKGHGYGNFMRILTSPAEAGFNGSEGEYGWDGWLGCYFSADPDEELAFLFFIQQTNSGCTDFVRKMQSIVRGAL